MRDFRKFTIWQEGIKLVKMTYVLTKHLPKEETYGLKSQMERASVSIPSNIAEGSTRSSDLEFKRFLEIALGSSFELETQLIVVKELYDINTDKIDEINNCNNSLQKMLNGFISKLKERK